MTQLTIHKLRLYKQGIGYFERRGVIEGTSTSLVMPREATNDALKSINIVVNEGGPILSVDYETPEDKNRLLSELPVKITDRSGLVDLLNSLRGSTVTLRLNTESTTEGRIIGVDLSIESAGHPPVLILQGENITTDIQIVPIDQIQGLRLRDERPANDIEFFLNISQIEQTQTTLTVRLSEGQHDLSINYLAPSPTWRVSYRIIGGENGKARLIGWGLFDNSLDEDLEDISLTLVSGRPISFEYGLYESRTPSRPKVSDDPIGLESVSGDPRVVEALQAISHDLRTPLASLHASSELLQRMGTLTDQQGKMVNVIRQNLGRMSDLIDNLLNLVRLREDKNEENTNATGLSYRSGPLGDLKVSASYFAPMLIGNAEPEFMTYEVNNPISVRRGQSAMVTIIETDLTYEELHVYNGDKMPNHPLLVWHLQNTTGQALEQGPVTLFDKKQYVGEGLLRFTGVGDDVQLAYALEFGILVTEDIEVSEKVPFSIDFDSEIRQAIVRRYQITNCHYTLVSRITRPLDILIERRDPSRGEYFEMSTPFAQHSGHTRWAINVPASGEVRFTVSIREVFETRETVSEWTESFVEDHYNAGRIAEGTYTLIQRWLNERQQISNEAEEIKGLQSEYAAIITLQEQLRKNLNALGQSERELMIRNRVLDDLEISENRRREIESLTASLNAQIKQRLQTQNSLLEQIYGIGE